MNPSLVKVQIHHPPEASVQIHQVARVRGELDPVLEDNIVETRASRRPHGNLGHSPWASNSIPARAGEAPRPPPVLSRHYGLLGQCYLSTVNGQVRRESLPQTSGTAVVAQSVLSLVERDWRSFHFPYGKICNIKSLVGWGCGSVGRGLGLA